MAKSGGTWHFDWVISYSLASSTTYLLHYSYLQIYSRIVLPLAASPDPSSTTPTHQRLRGELRPIPQEPQVRLKRKYALLPVAVHASPFSCSFFYYEYSLFELLYENEALLL